LQWPLSQANVTPIAVRVAGWIWFCRDNQFSDLYPAMDIEGLDLFV
jgi:hypothetical protein